LSSLERVALAPIFGGAGFRSLDDGVFWRPLLFDRFGGREAWAAVLLRPVGLAHGLFGHWLFSCFSGETSVGRIGLMAWFV